MLILGLNVASVLAQADSFTLHITVVDEETSEPIEDAIAGVSFSPGGALGGASRTTEATTNKDGKVTIKGESIFPMGVGAKKEGWYSSGLRAPNRVPDEKGKYHPKNEQEITLKLRKIKKPIGLFAKSFKGYLPEKDKKIGFDMEKGDWVTPYGKGIASDLIFKFTGKEIDNLNYEGQLSLTFANESDGLSDMTDKISSESSFKTPYRANVESIGSSFLWEKSRSGKEKTNTVAKDAYYFVRVRSTTDSEGIIKKANYGKIYEGIKFDPRTHGEGACYVYFTYYFNPTVNDTNLEFDPDKNLFGNIDSAKQVKAP